MDFADDIRFLPAHMQNETSGLTAAGCLSGRPGHTFAPHHVLPCLRPQQTPSGFSQYISLPARAEATAITACQWSCVAMDDCIDILAGEHVTKIIIGGTVLTAIVPVSDIFGFLAALLRLHHKQRRPAHSCVLKMPAYCRCPGRPHRYIPSQCAHSQQRCPLYPKLTRRQYTGKLPSPVAVPIDFFRNRRRPIFFCVIDSSP